MSLSVRQEAADARESTPLEGPPYVAVESVWATRTAKQDLQMSCGACYPSA